MAGTVKLPVLGTVKSGYVWAGVAIVTVIVGVAYSRRSHPSSSSSGSSGVSSASTAAASIDPQTGYPYGSAEDEAALAQLQSSAYGYGAYGSAYGEGAYYGYTGTGINGASANTGPGTFTDNAYWLAYASENITGYAASDIQAALSAYLAGVPLTATQMSIVQVALGVAGTPPNPPPTPTLASTGSSSSSSSSSSGSGTTTATKPPRVIGKTVAQGIAAIQAAGFVIGTVSESGIAGVRNEATLPASQYGTSLIVAQSLSGNTVSLIAA